LGEVPNNVGGLMYGPADNFQSHLILQRKPIHMRTKLIAMIALPLALTIGLGGCAQANAPTTSKPKQSAAAIPTPTKTPVSDNILAREDANDHSGLPGTRGNPAPAGSLVDLGSGFSAKVGPINLNAADDVAKNLPKAQLRKAGDQWILFRVVYDLKFKTTVSSQFGIDFIAADGTVYNNLNNQYWYPGTALDDIGEDAGTTSALPMLIEVPSKDVDKGLIAVRNISVPAMGTVVGTSPRYYLKLK
jgi:hypothetical protein